MKYLVFGSLLFFVSFSLFSACKSPTKANQPEKGFVSVVVIDENEEPVKDVEIYLAPDGISQVTDKNGQAFFTVDAGDYFIDANVCCIGPGFINYHKAVTVEKSDTVKQELKACMKCL